MGGGNSKSDKSFDETPSQASIAQAYATGTEQPSPPPLLEIEDSNVEAYDKAIAHGSFAIVYEGLLFGEGESNGKEPCAIKVFKIEAQLKADTIIKQMEEARLAFEVSSKNHPNIVNVKGIWRGHRSRQLAIVMERCTTSLFERLENPIVTESGEKLMPSMSEKRSILKEVCTGMIFLRKHNVFHGDLTTKNILLVVCQDSIVAKITDFGLSRVVDGSKLREHSLNHGNEDFMPPEMLKRNSGAKRNALKTTLLLSGAEQIDLFSYGCCAIHLGSGKYPKPGPIVATTPMEASQVVVSEHGRREKYIKNIPSSERSLFSRILKNCLCSEASERGTFSEILALLEGHEEKYAGNEKQLYDNLAGKFEDLRGKSERVRIEKEKLQRDLQEKKDAMERTKKYHDDLVSNLKSKADEVNKSHRKLSEDLKNEKINHEDTRNEVVKLTNERDDLKNKLEEKNDKLQELQKESSSMKNAVSSVGQFIEDFKKAELEKNAMKQERDNLESELLKLKGLNTKESKDLKNCRMQLRETEDKLKRKHTECQSISEELRKTQRSYEELEGTHRNIKLKESEYYSQLLQWEEWSKTKTMELSSLESSQANLQDELSAKMTKLLQSEEARSSVTSKLKKATESSREKDKEIASLQNELRSDKGNKSKLEKEKLCLEKQLGESKHSASDWKKKVDSVEKEFKKIKSQLQESQHTTANFKESEKKKDKLCRELQQKNEQLKKQCDQLKQQCDDMEEEISSLKAARTEHEATNQSLNSSLMEVQRRLEALSKTKREMETERKNLESSLLLEKKEVGKLQKEKNQLKEERDRYKSKLDVRMEDLQKAQAKCSEAEKENTLLKKSVEDKDGLIEQSKSMAARIEELEETARKKEESLESVTVERDQLKTKLQNTTFELDTAQDMNERNQRDLDTKGESIKQLESRVVYLKSKLESANTKETRLTRQLQEKQEEHEGNLKALEEDRNEQIEDLKVRLNAAMTDMSKVQANRDALKKEYVEVLAANEELAKTLRQLQTYPKEEKLKLEERIRQLQESLREEEKARGDLEGRLILEEKFHEEHQVNLQKKEDLLVQCRQDREKHEDEVMDLQVKRKEMEKHSKEKDERIQILTRDIRSLKEELAILKMERSQLSLKNDSLHATVTTRDKEIQRLFSERDNSTALLEKVKDKEQECKDLKEQLHEVEGKIQELANQLSEYVADNNRLKRELRELELVQSALQENQSEKERCLSQKQGQIDSLQMHLDQVISDNGNLRTRLNEADDKVQTAKKESLQETARATKYKHECDEKGTKLKELKDEHSWFEGKYRECYSTWTQLSVDIVAIQPYMYFLSQLTRVFHPKSACEFDEKCRNRQKDTPDCLAKLFLFDKSLPQHVHMLVKCKDPKVSGFLNKLMHSTELPIQGHFCIVDVIDGFPRLHLFIVNSSDLLLTETSAPQESQKHSIHVAFPLDTKWCIKGLPQIYTDAALYKPDGVFPSPEESLEQLPQLPPLLKPIVSWITGKLIQDLKAKITQLTPSLHKGDDHPGLLGHPVCSVYDRER